MCTVSDTPEKNTAAVNFRCPQTFRDKIDGLSLSSGWSPSDIARIGLLAFWPEIVALVTAGGQRPPENLDVLRGFIELCRDAKKRGVDPRQAIAAALDASLDQSPVV